MLTLVANKAAAINLLDEQKQPLSSVSLLSPTAKLQGMQFLGKGSGISGFRVLAYTMGFTGGAILGYGLVPLLTGSTNADGRHNTFIAIGGIIIGLSIPVAIIADKEDAIIRQTTASSYRKYAVPIQLCIVGNKEGLGLALNF